MMARPDKALPFGRLQRNISKPVKVNEQVWTAMNGSLRVLRSLSNALWRCSVVERLPPSRVPRSFIFGLR